MAVYWIGQDNNVWYKGDDGRVVNRGAANDLFPGGKIDDSGISGHRSGSFEAQRIDDPNVRTTPAPRDTVTRAPQLNQAAIDSTRTTLDQLPAILQAALAAETQRYRNTVADFDRTEQEQRGVADRSTVTNQQNYDANYMDALRAGRKGLQGLLAVLRGTGMEGWARDVVGDEAANDIRLGFDTHKENQTQIDDALSGFLGDLKRKRTAADDTRANNERAIQRENLSETQKLMGQIAGYYGEADRQSEYNDWMGRATALTPQIAANRNAQVSAYDTTPVPVRTAQISAFEAPTQPNAAIVPSDGQVGSGIFAITDRRRREPEAAGV